MKIKSNDGIQFKLTRDRVTANGNITLDGDLNAAGNINMTGDTLKGIPATGEVRTNTIISSNPSENMYIYGPSGQEMNFTTWKFVYLKHADGHFSTYQRNNIIYHI